MDKSAAVKKTAGIIGTVLFFISYIPYFALAYTGISGVQRGLFGGPYIYGFDAMWNMFVWTCIIPVFPICILYQLIFGIFYIRKNRILTAATLITFAVAVTAILSVGLTYESMKRNHIKEDFEFIKGQLSEEYGCETHNFYGIRVLDYEERSYMLRSTVLPENVEFAVYTNEDYRNDLISQFESYNGNFHSDYEAYLDRKIDMPENMHIQAHIISIDFGSFRDGDDYTALFDKVTYEINGITVELGYVDDSIVTDTLQQIWKEQSPKIENNRSNRFVIMTRNSDQDYYTVYIKVNGQNAYSVTLVYRLYNNSNKACATVNTYSDYKGNTALDGKQIELER